MPYDLSASSFKTPAGCKSWLGTKPVFYWFPWAVLQAASPSFTEPWWLGAQRADATQNAVTATLIYTPDQIPVW